MSKSRLLNLIIICLLVLNSLFFIIRKTTPSLITNNNEESDSSLGQEQEEVLPEELNFLFFGDMMLDRHVRVILESSSVAELLGDLKTDDNVFANKDIVGANFEGALTYEGKHYPPINLYDFAFLPEHVEALADFNFNYFALANNHFLDQGQRGVDETREILADLGYYFSGSPDAVVDEFSRTDLEIKGTKIALISLSMVYQHFDADLAQALVEVATKESDLVILNIHWGNEYEHNFNIYQQNIAHLLIEAGVDIIIGHHPHVVQGMEVYQGKPIFYSLGNFVFDQYFSTATQEGLALAIDYTPSNFKINLLPFKSSLSKPKFMTEEDKAEFLQRFLSWSELEPDFVESVKAGRIELEFNK